MIRILLTTIAIISLMCPQVLAQDTAAPRQDFDTLIKTSVRLAKIKPYDALECAAQARQMAEQQEDSIKMALAYKQLGYCYFRTRVYCLAMELQFKAFDMYSKMAMQEEMAGCLVDISKNYCSQDMYDIAEGYCIQAIEICRQNHYPETQADALASLGHVSMYTNQDVAIPNMRNAKSIYDSLGVVEKSMSINIHMARTYSRMGMQDSAFALLDYNLEQCVVNDDKENIARTYMALGDVYDKTGDQAKSATYYKNALKIFGECEMSHDARVCRLRIAAQQLAAGDYAKALENSMGVYSEAQLAEIEFGNEEIVIKHRACLIIYNAYKGLGNMDQSLVFCERFAQTGDSVFLLKKREQFAEFQVSLASQQKQKEIEVIQINAEKELLMVEKTAYNRNLILMMVIIALVIAMVIIYYRRYKEKVRGNTALSLSNSRMEQEIKERKIAESELRNSEERYRILFRKTPIGIVQFNDKFVITAINERCMQIFGIKTKTAIGQDVYTLLPQKYFEGFSPENTKTEADAQTIKQEIKLNSPSGELYVAVILRPYFYNTGSEVEKGGIMIVEDITERISAQKQSEVFGSSSNSIVNMIPEEIYLLDNKANYIFAQVPSLSISQQNAYVGKNIRELVQPDILLQFLVAFNTVRKTGETQYADYQPYEGSDVCHEAQFMSVNDDQVLVVVRDITRHKMAEAKLKTAKYNAESGSKAKSEFILGMTAEIKPPLEIILRNCEHIVASVQDKVISAKLKEVLNSALFVNETFTDILKLTEVEAVDKNNYTRMVNPVTVAKDVYDIFKTRAEEKKLEYNFICSDNIPNKLMLDEVRLRQILFNIISNGIKYTEHGGVSFNLSSEPMAEEGEVKLIFKISDTGVGLSQEQISNLFSNTNEKKGMALTKKMVDAIKGKISVISSQGEGSEFVFELPNLVTDQKPKVHVAEVTASERRAVERAINTRKKNSDAMHEYISVLKYAVIPEYKAMKSEISFKVLTEFVSRFREQSVHYHIDKGVEIADELLANIHNYDIQDITINIRKLETYILNNIKELQGDRD